MEKANQNMVDEEDKKWFAFKQVVIEEFSQKQSTIFENWASKMENLVMSNTNYGKGTPNHTFELMKEKEGQKQPSDPSDPGSGSSSESSSENNSGDDEPNDNNNKGRNSKKAESKIKGKRHKSTSKTRKLNDKWIRDPAQRLDSFININTRFGGKQGEDMLR